MENARLARLLDGKIVIGSPSESFAGPAGRNPSLAHPICGPVLDDNRAISTGCHRKTKQRDSDQTDECISGFQQANSTGPRSVKLSQKNYFATPLTECSFRYYRRAAKSDH